MGYVLDESDRDYSTNIASGRKVAGAIRFIVNAWNLLHECARALHEALLMPILSYGSEIMVKRKKETVFAFIRGKWGLGEEGVTGIIRFNVNG